MKNIEQTVFCLDWRTETQVMLSIDPSILRKLETHILPHISSGLAGIKYVNLFPQENLEL